MDERGRARMVDTSGKPQTVRKAVARGDFVAAKATLDRLVTGNLPKGEALAVARIAAVAAAKRTDEIIPLCHSLPLDHAQVDFERVAEDRLRVRGSASVVARTGVEMEALVAVVAACLTLYDMTKAIDPNLRIEAVVLEHKQSSDVAIDKPNPHSSPAS